MPLQKLPPQGPSSNDSHASKRRQAQNRRRTLQTISELTTTDGTAPDFVSFITAKRNEDNANVGGKTNESRKRQSLPPYCISPACVQVQTTVAAPSLRPSVSQHSLQGHRSSTSDLRKYEAGWNARRERARAHREQALVKVGDAHATFNQYQPSTNTSRPAIRHSQSNPVSYSTQKQLLRNSRSISGFSQINDIEPSARASTDSSSFHSSHDSAIRRSRSGSSSDRSFASSRTTPPLPIDSPPPIPHYYTSPISYNQYMPPVSRSKTPKQERSTSGYRSSSLPTIRIDRPRSAPYDHEHHKARTSTLPTYQKHQFDIQRARLESLAALTASPPPLHQLNTSSLKQSQHHHNYNHHPHPQRLSLPFPNPQQQSPHHHHQHQHRPRQPHHNHHPHRSSLHTPRTLPKRESLTQWKAERDNAQAGREYLQRAKMMERVRRANEQERERERELRALAAESCRGQVDEKVGSGSGSGCDGVEGDEEEEEKRTGRRREVRWGKGKGEANGCLKGIWGIFGGRG
ncbi:hypothetical protein J1614_004821 [Plenodomus biglobosus]|nr:hypothetical protein J1614_004821 [Plenodomus biglobosus]